MRITGLRRRVRAAGLMTIAMIAGVGGAAWAQTAPGGRAGRDVVRGRGSCGAVTPRSPAGGAG